MTKVLDTAKISTHFASDDESSGGVVESTWFLWEHRQIIAKAVLVGTILGLALAFLIPEQFEATVTLMPPESRNDGASLLLGLASGNNALGSLATDVLGPNRGGAMFVGILRSRTIQSRVVERFNLMEVYGDRYLVDAIEDLNTRSFISEDRKSGIISITVRDRSPLRAANLAQGYVTELDRVVTEVSTSAARRERIFLEDRLKKVKQDLDAAAVEFSQFASRNAALNINEQGKAMMEAIARLTGELIAAESELKGLEQIYAADNVRVRTVQARIKELRTQIARMGGVPDQTGSPTTDFPTLRGLPLLGVRYAELYRRNKIQEAIYEILVRQYELSKVQEAKEIPAVRVLDKISIPEKKVFPSRLGVLLVSQTLSLLACMLFLLGRRQWAAVPEEHTAKRIAQDLLVSARNAKQRFRGPKRDSSLAR